MPCSIPLWLRVCRWISISAIVVPIVVLQQLTTSPLNLSQEDLVRGMRILLTSFSFTGQ
jgi:hypothetical protein